MKRLLLFVLTLIPLFSRAVDFRGAQFIGFSDFSKFKQDGGVLISPVIEPSINWDELVLSWNLRGAGQAVVEARVLGSDSTTKFYQMGVWSAAARHSVTNQADADGNVETDVLRVKKPGGKLEARITLTNAKEGDLKFFAFSFKDSKEHPVALEPNRRAWGKTIEVRTRSQLDSPEGAKIWCSPTSSSMLLDYWSQKLNRPELSLTVPEVAKAVHDPNWPGTGNWPFNTAFAGNFPDLRAYVTRLTDVSELEAWIEAGIPIATSVSYNRLKGLGKPGSGHLIVCVGFTETGDIVVNDPGTQLSNVRRTFPRDTFREAWADSANTVYIIHPEDASIPLTRFNHWETRIPH